MWNWPPSETSCWLTPEPAIRVRLAGPDAWPAVARIHALSWRSAYRGIYPDDYLDREAFDERRSYWRETLAALNPAESAVFLAEDAGQPTGFACIWWKANPNGPFLDNLHVLPERKGEGIGRG